MKFWQRGKTVQTRKPSEIRCPTGPTSFTLRLANVLIVDFCVRNIAEFMHVIYSILYYDNFGTFGFHRSIHIYIYIYHLTVSAILNTPRKTKQNKEESAKINKQQFVIIRSKGYEIGTSKCIFKRIHNFHSVHQKPIRRGLVAQITSGKSHI